MIFPKVLITTVIRIAQKGDTHGQVFLVDLNTGKAELKINWDNPSINWDGRGGDRGLRGIAIYNDFCYIASSDTIHVYNKNFEQVKSHTCSILKDCHEIFIYGDKLYIASSGYDCIAVFNISQNRFTHAYQLRYHNENWLQLNYERIRRKFAPNFLPPRRINSRYIYLGADSDNFDQITSGDTLHINSVYVDDSGIFFATQKNSNYMFRIVENKVSYYCLLKSGTHNVQPYQSNIIYNDTFNNKVVLVNKKGKELISLDVINYKENELTHTDIPQNYARQGWGRGLTIFDQEYIIAGSSPATLSVYSLNRKERIKYIQLSKDIRNTIHGLEIWQV